MFDSTLIEDDGVFRRRKGRIGWKALLGDADAYIRSILPRSVVFAEYKSVPMLSYTPVDGAQLFASFTGNEQLWSGGVEPFPLNSTNVVVTNDYVRTTDTRIPGGENTFRTHSADDFSFRVETYGTENVGIQTGFMNFVDFSQAQFQFNIWFTGEPRDPGIETFILPLTYGELEEISAPEYSDLEARWTSYESILEYTRPVVRKVVENNIIAQIESEEGTVIPLPMPELETNQWQQVILHIPSELVVQTGKWRLQIIQPTSIPSTWWIDALYIFERVVQWSARSVASNPWNSNYAPWTDFGDIVNVNRRGILLSPRGKELQLRARALRQNAVIKSPKIIPRYASLGRLVFPEEELQGRVAPVAAFSAEGVTTKEALFTDKSTSNDSTIGQREWSFGDGEFETGNETLVSHVYAQPGEYYVTLVVTDRNGLRSQTTQTYTVPL